MAKISSASDIFFTEKLPVRSVFQADRYYILCSFNAIYFYVIDSISTIEILAIKYKMKHKFYLRTFSYCSVSNYNKLVCWDL